MKRKLLFAIVALMCSVGVWAQPTASTPVVGQTYYLYNPITKLFLTTNVDLPFVRPTGSAWTLEEANGHEGWITLRLKDNTTDGCGYFWGKWWANNPAQNSSDYSDERVFQLVKISDYNYKFRSYVWGETEAYIYINNGNEGDRSFRLACNSQDQTGMDEGYVTWQFISEEDYSAYMANDYTSRISNNDFLNGTSSWTLVGDGNKQAHGNTAIEYWKSKAADGNFDYYQNLSGLPAGKYVLRAAMYNSTNGEEGASFDQSGQCGVYGTSNEVTKNANVTVDGTSYNIYTTDELLVPDGNLRLGFKNSTTMTARWFGVDWIQLTCVEYCLSAVATALPSSGAMEADKWYYIDIAVAADNYNATATTLGDIVFTTDGTILLQDQAGVTANFTATDNSLSATRYYVKSSSANNLVVAAASYTYEVGDATVNIADGSYISALSTVTFTFADASTNNPEASFALLNGSAKAILTKGGENVAEGTLSIAGKVLTATFSDLELALSSTYDIAIAAGVVGYEGQATNAAINTSFNTGAIAEGLYYFQKKGTQKYLGRGGSYGTEAVLADLGISFELALQADGSYTFKNHDHSLAANTAKYLNYNDGNGGNYTDQTAYGYKLEASEGGYYMRPDATYYMTSTNYSTNLDVPYDFLNRTETVGDAIVWVPISKETYKSNIAAVRDAEAEAIATSAGISATTLAALKTAIASDYGTTDVTSSIKNAECKANLDNWTQVKYAPNGQKNFDANGTCGEVWDGLGGIKQSITGLKEGIYKVSIRATWRPGGKESGSYAGNEINTNAWVYANTATSENLTQLKSWYAGGASIDSRADMVASGDGYLNDVYVYVSDGETLTIGLASPTKCNGAWLPFFDWTLTYYEAKATATEKTALADAITAAEAKTLGFKANEYAPYRNIDALAVLAAAKAINPETASGVDVVAATTALTGATWNKNSAEVNAFCGGDFTQYETIDGKDYPYGWNLYNPGNNNSRIMGGSEGTSNAGLSATTSGKALLLKFNATYGESEGYTMPLKAATLYKITFKHGRWGEANPRVTDVVMTDPDGASITLAPGFQAETNDCQSNSENWYTYTGYFVSTKAGDYKFNLTKQGGNSQMQIAIADIDLRTASELEFADGSVPTYAPGTYPSVKITRNLTANRWATAVYPFAVSGVDNIAVLDSYDAETGALGFTSATASTANQPFLMRSTAGATEISLSNVEVAAAAAEPVVTKNEASLKGTYTSTAISNAEKNYVLSNNQIFSVGEAGATINPYRAYIQIDQSSEVKALTFFVDDTETAIEGINADVNNDAEIFNLAGQRVNKAQRGIYIINGKKVLVK